jgi:CRISPR-associated protein Cmr2
VAKSGTGRDSLAVGVWTSSGIATQWSAPWEHFVLDWETNRTVFDDIREGLQKKDDPLLSNSFLYKLSMYESLLENQEEAVLDQKQVKRLLFSDYVRILGDYGKWTDEKKEKIEKQMDRLLQVCFVVKRSMKGDTAYLRETNEFKADGAILAKFLAQKGFEKDA